MNQFQYKIQGMDCAEEVALIKKVLLPVVKNDETCLQFDLLKGKLTVNTPDQDINQEDLASIIKKTGLHAEPWIESELYPDHRKFGYKEIFCLLSGLSLLLGFFYHAMMEGWLTALMAESDMSDSPTPTLTVILYVITIVTGARFFAPKGFHALRILRPDINLLVTVAIIGAIALGEFFEAAMVAFLFSVALLLESWSVGRARNAIRALMDMSPQNARRIEVSDDDKVIEVLSPVETIVPGETIVVHPGERIPLDGKVHRGITSVNQAPITGESLPVPKKQDDMVYAGSINNEGAIEIEVTRPAKDSSLARIVRMVEEAQSRRAPAEQWVEKFARYYTPAMMGLALLIALLPPLIMGMPWGQAIYLSLVMLLIACPCALVISTPVSIVAGLSTAARSGILIKGGAYLEAPAHLRAVAFDKTGTLTEGKPQVQKVSSLNHHDETLILQLAATLESRSQHPLAQAIVSHAAETGVTLSQASNHQAIEGKGAKALIEGKPYWIGNARLARELCQRSEDQNVSNDQHDFLTSTLEDALSHAESVEDAGHSVVILGCDNEPMGLISIADTPRVGASETLLKLKKYGIHNTIMLTGDNQGTARSLAEMLGINEFYAGLLPEDKVDRINDLKAAYGNVAMVGDGINDAPALAAANLAISMGAIGSDAAIETSDIALMSDDITKLPWLIRHSKRTLRIIKQNIVIALGLKIVVLVLAFFGIAALWLAIVADMGASLLVISNGMRLLRGASTKSGIH